MFVILASPVTHGGINPLLCLRDLQLKVCYRTPDDILNSFYIPCLESSVIYRRATGFFTSTALAEAARGLVQFARNGGRMLLVASPRLTEEDVRDLKAGYDARQLTERALIRGLHQPIEEPDMIRVQNLTWMIQNDLLEIRIARPTFAENQGIFHEKMGLFLDSIKESDANVVAFSGSLNETGEGLVSNYESIDVSVSWEHSQRESNRVHSHMEHFENLWNGRTYGLEVMEFPEAVRREMIEIYKSQPEPSLEPGRKRSLRPFQLEAINAWEKAHSSGILAMATGSGKTFTALKCLEKHPDTVVLIVVPQRDLVSQWCSEIEQEFPNAIVRRVESDEKDWPTRVERMMSTSLPGKRPFIVATIQSGCKDKFIDLISQISKDRLAIVVDEVHHAGAPEYSRIFEIQANLRLGLSATPYRMWDDEGNQRIFDYFGGQVFEYSIAKAISDGVLCPYRYYIHPVGLIASEREKFKDFSRAISRLLFAIWARQPGLKGMSLPSVIQSLAATSPAKANELRGLYLRRISLVKAAVAKYDALARIVDELPDLRRCLVYCNDLAHVARVVSLLLERGFEALEYTSEILPEARENLKKWLTENLEGTRFLVAIKCLDEGVDIPACDSAILISSSRSEREFIQRRGRVLRPYPSKKIATIHDIVVLPFVAPEEVYPLSESEVEFARAELRRVGEFARRADNGSEIDVAGLLKLYEGAFVEA